MKKLKRFWIYPLILIGFSAILLNACQEDDVLEPEPGPLTGTVTDKDGNTYSTVQIGSQIWMAENLRTTKFNDNTAIPNITDNELWFFGYTAPAYCWYDNSEYNKTPYGALYNWQTINTGKLAPEGWHVATKDDWEQLVDYLGGATVAAAKLMETGPVHWPSPNADATNETGFTALAAGYRYTHGGDDVFDINYDGKFHSIGFATSWWTATEDLNPYSSNIAWAVAWEWDWHGVNIDSGPQGTGLSVRCVKD